MIFLGLAFLLEIEGEDNHGGAAAVEAVGVLHQGLVDEVAAVVDNDVAEAEAELQLGNQLEVAEVDVAAKTDLEIAVETLGEQGVVLAGGEVYAGRGAEADVGPEVVVAGRCHLQQQGQRDVGGFDVLCGIATAELLMEDDMLLTKMQGGLQTQTKSLVQTQLAHDTHGEARLEVIDLGEPLLAGGGVDVAVVGQLHVHHVQADEEAIVQEAVIQIRTVLDTGLLRCGRQHGEGGE